MEIKQYIQENEERFLNELFSLIRIPSISALPAHKAGLCGTLASATARSRSR